MRLGMQAPHCSRNCSNHLPATSRHALHCPNKHLSPSFLLLVRLTPTPSTYADLFAMQLHHFACIRLHTMTWLSLVVNPVRYVSGIAVAANNKNSWLIPLLLLRYLLCLSTMRSTTTPCGCGEHLAAQHTTSSSSNNWVCKLHGKLTKLSQ